MTFEFTVTGFPAMRFASFIRNLPKLMQYVGWKVFDAGSWFYLQRNGETLRLTPEHLGLMMYEWPHWEQLYVLPDFDFKGKTILDVGCGCGETAHFYYDKGAGKIIGIEPDPVAAAYFQRTPIVTTGIVNCMLVSLG